MTATAGELPDHRPSYRAAAIVSALVFVLYLVTLAPSTAMWDTSEYIAAAYVLGLPHPPGNPLFILIAHAFGLLPLPGSYAQRINVLAALTSAASAGIWFLVTERVLAAWLPQRWQRISGGVLSALIGATAFSVWNQSVVMEKVYPVSLLFIAVISWLAIRWIDRPDGPKADRTLVLIAYLIGLGYAVHPAGFLAVPAVGVAVLLRRPQTVLQCAGILRGTCHSRRWVGGSQPYTRTCWRGMSARVAPARYPGSRLCRRNEERASWQQQSRSSCRCSIACTTCVPPWIQSWPRPSRTGS